jgi:hypothetical protein
MHRRCRASICADGKFEEALLTVENEGRDVLACKEDIWCCSRHVDLNETSNRTIQKGNHYCISANLAVSEACSSGRSHTWSSRTLINSGSSTKARDSGISLSAHYEAGNRPRHFRWRKEYPRKHLKSARYTCQSPPISSSWRTCRPRSLVLFTRLLR